MAKGRGISRDIVVVNEFTIHGSRGHTPGRYVIEYMAREGATENLTPTMARPEKIRAMEEEMHRTYRRHVANGRAAPVSDYVTRYMARDTATEIAALEGSPDVAGLKSDFDAIQGYAGLAFGPDSLSLSHKEVLAKARMLQDEFDKGKPVMKTVISFSTDYLKKMGVLPESLEVRKPGDLYGKSDQAKLRLAIQHGLGNIRSEYSDLDWIGLIQVDTMHLHCHLAMADKGPGKHFTKDGEQRGMLTGEMKAGIRRGIDNSLSQCALVKPLSIQMESERRNTLGFIKRFTHRIMEERGLPQYLLACLPKDDRSLWKASINADGGPENEMTVTKGGKKRKIRGNMKKANEIVRGYVVDLLNRPDSGFAETMSIKHDYLIAQMNRGDFDEYYTYKTRGTGRSKKSVRVKLAPEEAVRDLEAKFREDVTVRGMNAVYDVLKGVDDRALTLHTPMLDAMGMPYEEMASHVKDDKLIEFGFRLRSYSNRLDYHKNCYRKVNKVIHQYEDGEQASYNPESKVVYDFLKVEQEYNHALMCKYQTFLHFFHVKDEYQAGLDEIMDLRYRSRARHAMERDKSLIKSGDVEKIEKRGVEEYGVPGASLLLANPELFRVQTEAADKAYARGLRNFREDLAEIGMLFDEPTGEVARGAAYDFEEVKAYDLHHMSYDYTYDFRIASENIDRFAAMADRRHAAYLAAHEYLRRTGQEDALEGVVNPDDIMAAKSLADEYRASGPTYRTMYDDAAELRRNTATIRLDDEVYRELNARSMMRSLQDIMDELAVQPAEPAADWTPGRRDRSDGLS